MDLFTLNMEKNLSNSAPLSDRLRPRNLDEFYGQKHLVGEGRYLNRVILSDQVPSIIFYGPPGVGKTTLAEIIAKSTKKRFEKLSAVASNLKQLREVLNVAEDNLKLHGVRTILFIDEIHRFNKTQQDGLLPFVEKGIVILIGATTENPYFEVNKALLSRCRLLNLYPLNYSDLEEVLNNALSDRIRGFGNKKIDFSKSARDFLIKASDSDARAMLNSLEIAVLSTDPDENGVIVIDEGVLEDCIQKKYVKYDKGGQEHYNTISAFIKSMRGSDPDAAIYYLARMLEAGEDVKFIARRMIILASEDIGLADPNAINVATSVFNGVNMVGMPEARIILAEGVIYLATAPKSNSAYLAIDSALNDIRNNSSGTIPTYLRDSTDPILEESHGKYKYPHSYQGGYVKQDYLPEEFRDRTYYNPKRYGFEDSIYTRLLELRKIDNESE